MKTNNTEGQSQFVKRQVINPGIYPAVLVRIYDLGSKVYNYGDKEKVRRNVLFIFELPLEKHTYRDGDVPKPAWVHRKFNFNMFYNPTTNISSSLYNFTTNAMGKKLTPEEASEFDFDSLLGQQFILTIGHKEWNNVTYEEIQSAVMITDRNRELYNIKWDQIKPVNEVFSFEIGEHYEGFESETFNKLGGWGKHILNNSLEGEKYLAMKKNQ